MKINNKIWVLIFLVVLLAKPNFNFVVLAQDAEDSKVEIKNFDLPSKNTEPEQNNESDASSIESSKTVEGEDDLQPESESRNKPTLLKGRVTKVPGGTKLKVILETPIDEISSMADDEITPKTSENVVVDGGVVIPAGSTVVGIISEISHGKRLHKSGNVRIEFKSLTMPDGNKIPIVASVLTHSGLIKGKLTKKNALISTATIVGPAAAGFGAGLAAEGSLVGAGIGALVGTLAGVGLFSFQKGNMVDLKSGDELSIELTEEALVPVSKEEANKNKYCNIK